MRALPRSAAQLEAENGDTRMRRKRTIYFNDARHYYLFVFEPPMTMEDAWHPIDECAGTSVDTFIYGVARSDGLYYPSRVGGRFKHGEHGADSPGFKQAAYYRVWHNMQSLIDRGLDPLTVLIDRAHEKGMDFFASLRLASHATIDPAHEIANGGRGWMHAEVRDHQFAVMEELATEYATDGIELDLAAAPGGSSYCFRDEDLQEGTPLLTEWVRRVSAMARNRPGTAGQVGARVYPTEEINRAKGLDVRTWLREGLLDFVVPLVYGYNLVDGSMPVDWLIEAAHDGDASVYPVVQPNYFGEEDRRFHTRELATPAMMRAAAASFWDRGADGMYTWFLQWPLGDASRRILTDLGDPGLVNEGDKHYVVRRTTGSSERAGYDAPLPIEIEHSDTGTRHPVSFYVADDVEAAADRIRQVLLKVRIYDLLSADRLDLLLNGRSLAGETCLRSYGDSLAPYLEQWLEFHLEGVRPRKGWNTLELVLERRAEGMMRSLIVEDVELIVEYGSYPSRLDYSPTA